MIAIDENRMKIHSDMRFKENSRLTPYAYLDWSLNLLKESYSRLNISNKVTEMVYVLCINSMGFLVVF